MKNEPLRHLAFDDVWKMRIDHPYSLIVKDGDLLWSCGQCPLDSAGEVLDPGDLLKQAHTVAGLIRRYLPKVDSDVSDIGQLIVYYVKTHKNDAQALIDIFRGAFGNDLLITPVSVPYFYYEGMLIEVDVFGAAAQQSAAAKRRHTRVDAASGLVLDRVDAGDLIWATLAARDLPPADLRSTDHLARLTEAAGLSSQHLLSAQWFVADEGALALADAAGTIGWGNGDAVSIDFDGCRAFASLIFCKTAVTRQSFAIDTDNADASAIKVTLARSGAHFCIDAQDNSPSRGLVAQTEAIMSAIQQVMDTAGLDFASVRKSTTYYVAGRSAEELHDNMAVRNRYYVKPGPASTGLPVKGFRHAGSLISVRVMGQSRVES